MKTYKFYLNSAEYFLNCLNSKLNEQEKEYYLFSSVIFSWLALESYTNSVCESLSKGTRLKPHETAFLKELELKVNDEGEFNEIKIKPSTTKKVLFIVQYFTKIEVKKFKQMDMWRKINNFEELRNKIIHHKEVIDIKIDKKQAESYYLLIKETILYFNKLLFRHK
jgi:hypothetical protein